MSRGSEGCLAPVFEAPSAALDLSTHLANSSAISAATSTSMKVGSLLNVLPLGLHSSHLAYDGGLDLHSMVPSELPRDVARDALVLTTGSSGPSSVMVNCNDLHNRLEWPSLQMGSFSDVEILETPLAIDFSYQQSHSDSFSAEGIWEGGKVNPEKVSKWVAAKLRGVTACLGVAFSGYENEVINLLSRIEKNVVLSKPSVLRSPPVVRRQRELQRLEFGVNYERAGSSNSGMLVPYV